MFDMASTLRCSLPPLVAVALLAAPVHAQVSYTKASGYVQVTVAGNTLGAVSATLQNKSDHTSNSTINDDWVDSVPQTPPTPDIPAQQTVTVAGAGWDVDEWASGHLAYIVDSSGGEEAFLILSNTSDTLTIATDFDLLDATRSIPNVTSISLRKAQTVGDLFGVGAANTDFTLGDKVYLWNGSGWTTYFLDGAYNWRKIGSFNPANGDVVYPDEGIFIERNDETDLTLTFFGDVPGLAQVTTMPGPGLQFVSSRYPVETTIGELGFHNLPNWQQGSGGDLVYIWTGTGWSTYFHTAGGWRKIGTFDTVDNDPVNPDSAIFVSRKGVSGLAESANFHTLPYTP